MPDRNAEYQATYRRRSAFNAQATLLGWTKLPILSAFITDAGELIVIDKAGNRYGTEAAALAEPEVTHAIVSPADVPAEEFGPRWNKARQKIGATLADLDLSEKDRGWALTAFEQVAANALRAVELLREHTGPDWREAIGLTEDNS